MKTISGIRRIALLSFAEIKFGRCRYLQPFRKLVSIIVRPIQKMSREVAETYLTR